MFMEMIYRIKADTLENCAEYRFIAKKDIEECRKSSGRIIS